jgi:hypothetical protein
LTRREQSLRIKTKKCPVPASPREARARLWAGMKPPREHPNPVVVTTKTQFDKYADKSAARGSLCAAAIVCPTHPIVASWLTARLRNADTCPSYNLVVVNAWIMPSVERNCLDVELK